MFVLKQGESFSLLLSNIDSEGVQQPWTSFDRVLVMLALNANPIEVFEYPTSTEYSELLLSEDSLTLQLTLSSDKTKSLKGVLTCEIMTKEAENVVIRQAALCSVLPSLIKDIL